MRRAALETAMAAYGPQALSLAFLAQELAFDSVEECRAFAVDKLGCVPLDGDVESLDTRASRWALSTGGTASSQRQGQKQKKGARR